MLQQEAKIKPVSNTTKYFIPGRNGARNRSSSAGRNGIGGDRFIPNRNTTDMDMAHHSLISSQEASSNNNTDIGDDLTENQRRQLNQQTKEILNVNNYF